MTPEPSPEWGPADSWQARRDDWSAEEMRALLAEYGRNPATLEVAPLPGGWENLNLLVHLDPPGGERLVLRRYDVTEPAEVPWELELLRFLTEKRFPTAALIPQTDGGLATSLGGRPAALFAFVPGKHPQWDSPTAGEQAGEVVALLHEVTAGLSLPYPRTRLDNRKRLARFQAWLAERGLSPEEHALAELAERVQEYTATFEARLAPRARALPYGVVHHDAHGNNLLVDERGDLVALLDFDDAHETYLLADLAVLIDVWGTDFADSARSRSGRSRTPNGSCCRTSRPSTTWRTRPLTSAGGSSGGAPLTRRWLIAAPTPVSWSAPPTQTGGSASASRSSGALGAAVADKPTGPARMPPS